MDTEMSFMSMLENFECLIYLSDLHNNEDLHNQIHYKHHFGVKETKEKND